jgi:K(+)-stimulated pyrophosphate-energized sodium pump
MAKITEAQDGLERSRNVNLDPTRRRETARRPRHTATMPDFVRYYNVTVMNPKVLVGVFMGVMLAFVFCALTMKAVGRAAGTWWKRSAGSSAKSPASWKERPNPTTRPACAISTAAAQREMIVPALLG